jgi:ribonuclease HI
MKNYLIFTDGSSHPQKKIGIGAFLLLDHSLIESDFKNLDKEELYHKVKINKFFDTSSSRLEVETVIWTLQEVKKFFPDLKEINFTLFTDSQTVAGLMGRRERLKNSNYIAKSSGKELRNSDLYKKFYKLYDELNLNIKKVKGHTSLKRFDTVQFIFSIVDQKVRSNLKKWIKDNE